MALIRRPRWVVENPGKAAQLARRIREGLREVGILLIAFAPLEAALNRSHLRDAWGFLVAFVGIGVTLFAFATFLEWRSGDVE